jgi:hypothetical protein
MTFVIGGIGSCDSCVAFYNGNYKKDPKEPQAVTFTNKDNHIYPNPTFTMYMCNNMEEGMFLPQFRTEGTEQSNPTQCDPVTWVLD